MVSVFLLFESAPIRDWVANLFPEHDMFQVVGEARHPMRALGEINRLQPDVIVMHSQSRRILGADILQAIRSVSPDSKVIMLQTSLHPDERTEPLPDHFLSTLGEWRRIPDLLRSIGAS